MISATEAQIAETQRLIARSDASLNEVARLLIGTRLQGSLKD